MNRRDVLSLGVAAGAASTVLSAMVQSADALTGFQIIDSNISLFQWPFRRLPHDNPTALVDKLRSLGITQAWAGSFEAILHRDIAGVNQRLVAACESRPELIPIGSINLELPGWKYDFARCVAEKKMPGIRLHPGYHGYTLADPRFVQLLASATSAGKFVQIAATLEDNRTQHPKLRVPDVDLTPLPKLMSEIPNARLQILNARLRPPLLAQLAKTPGVFFDTARVDGTDGIPKLAHSAPGQVLFGTHAPFLIPEAALIRVHESGVLNEARLRAVYANNAEAFVRVSA
jgi:predicted TIM-barrel fold metal-dependent hydrolase